MKLYLSSYRLGSHPERFARLLPNRAKVAVIVNAIDSKSHQDRKERLLIELEDLRKLGLKPTEVDLRNFYQTKITAKDLLGFDAVWVRGGNVFNLRRSFKQSGFDDVVIPLIKNDVLVYGGYSAGYCILSPTLHGVELCDHTNDVPEGLSSDIIWKGLGLIDYSIAPHYKSNHYESDRIENVVAYFKEHNMKYRTISDGESVVVNGDLEEKA
jgi:dipeptidase E